MDLNIVRAWKTDWNKRRILKWDELENELFAVLGPPWMETGIIRDCIRCSYRVWESLELKDGCPNCYSPQIRSVYPTTLDRFIHWWRSDNKFTTKHAGRKWTEIETNGGILLPMILPTQEEIENGQGNEETSKETQG